VKPRVPGCECLAWYPAGVRAYHSRYCAVTPNQPLAPDEEADWNARKASLRAHPVSLPAAPVRPLSLVERAEIGDDYSLAHSDDEVSR
jgi:hypothetical protein